MLGQSKHHHALVAMEIDDDIDNEEFEQLVDDFANGHFVASRNKQQQTKLISKRSCLLVLLVLLVVAFFVIYKPSQRVEEDLATNSTIHRNSTNTTTLHNYRAIIHQLESDQFFSEDEKLAMFLPLEPIRERTAALYSKVAQERLLHKLASEKRITLVANGASTTAMAGHIAARDSYYSHFAKYLEGRYPGLEVTTINVGHGGQMSYHTTVMAEYLLPPEADILIWEFSMNDEVSKRLGLTGIKGEHSVENGVIEERNLLLLWLEKIRQFYAEKPPVIILLYFWSVPLALHDDGTIDSKVFDHHNNLGAIDENVLGHAHVGDYFDHFEWTHRQLKNLTVAFHDDHHPSVFGHRFASLLMEQLLDKTLQSVEPLSGEEASYKWVCGDDADEFKKVYDVIISRKRLSKASFTPDLPTNQLTWNKKLRPTFLSGDMQPQEPHNLTVWWYGKQDPMRLDRLKGVNLPLCQDGRLGFEVSQHRPLHAVSFMIKVAGGANFETVDSWHRRQFNGIMGMDHGDLFSTNLVTGFRIWVDDREATSDILDGVNGTCIFHEGMFRKWLVFEPELDEAKWISMCTEQATVACETIAIF